MAKQSFVTGQVLTAQQVNDLQTNDFNQTVSAKTASYTLVAADKGTRITISSTSATTITVNTNLFAAGDTLFIQNLNTGVCTITPGTATVATSASLALAQHEGGTLYFTSAGVSTFFKAAGAAATSGALTFITSASLGATTNVNNCFTSTYANYLIQLNITSATTNADVNFRLRASGSDAVTLYDVRGDTTASTAALVKIVSDTNTIGYATITVAGPEIADRTTGSILAHGLNTGTLAAGYRNTFDHDANTQFDGFSIFSTATLTGTVRVYGYANS